MRKIAFNKGLLTILIYFLSAFVPIRSNNDAKYIFQSINAGDGLSNNSIRCIYKDSEGFLWIGTNSGLNRYNGYSFESFLPDPYDPTSISGKIAYAILEDNKQNLWIGTWGNGLNQFDRQKETFKRFIYDPTDSTTISHNWIMSMFSDSKGRLWIGTQNGLNLFNPESGTFKRFLTELNISSDPAQLRLSSLYDIKEDKYGNLWITTWSGLIMFNPESESFYHYRKNNSRNSITTDSLQAIYIDANNIIWIGTYKGAFEKIIPEYYNDTVLLNIKHFPMAGKGRQGMSDNRINAIVSDNNENLWIATEYGLNHFNPKTENFKNFYRDPNNFNTIPSNIVNDLYFDDEKILWIGTHDNGIGKFDTYSKKFENLFPEINSSPNVNQRFVKSLYEDRDGKLWIGTDYGILQYNDAFKREAIYPSAPGNPYGLNIGGVTGFFEDSLGNLWASTWGGGIHRYLENEKRFINIKNNNRFTPDEPGDNDIRVMACYNQKYVWLGTTRGYLDRFNPYTKKFDHFFIFDQDSLRGVPVVSIACEEENIIWAGAIQNGGLTRLNTQTNDIKRYFSNKSPGALPSNEILSLHLDTKGKLWLGTDIGMVLFNADIESFQLISGQKGLPSEAILSINEDKQGYLWLGTPNSLIKYQPVDSTVIIYNKSDGIYPGASKSLLTRDGNMLFGGINGLNYFNPEVIYANEKKPRIIFTELKIRNETIDFTRPDSPIDKHINFVSALTLDYDQSFLSISFAALNYSHPEKNQYAYKLIGLENSWNYVGTTRNATYANLQPGNYTFNVIASNNDGVWNESGRTLNITILPPWWKSIPAFIGYIVILFTSFLLIFHILNMRRQMKTEIRLQQIEFEKEKALAKKEHEINQMKLKFFTNISHEFRTPLTLVISPVNDILNSMNIPRDASDHLKLVKKNAHRLLRLINQILDFSKVEAGFMRLDIGYANFSEVTENIVRSFEHRAKKKRINYNFSIDDKDVYGYFDVDKIEKIMYNLISNAFKFTSFDGNITVYVHFIKEEENLTSDDDSGYGKAKIVISDNGKGIPKEHLESIFNRFHQASSNDKGTGIGLSLANSLAQIHRGKIEVSSEVEIGTTFILHIPLKKEVYHDLKIEEAVTQKDYFTSYFFPKNNISEKIRDEEMPVDLEAPNILIVEDEEDMRNYIKGIFKSKFNVYTANNGAEGLALSRKIIPDQIISDIMMPEMDGIELTRIIKTTAETSHIPVVLLTAKATKDDKLTGFETGADDYIVKPFESDELLMKINNIISTRKKFQKKFAQHPEENIKALPFNSMDKKIMEDLLRIINENIEDPNLDYKLICKQMGMSRAKLYRKMKALTDQSVHEFIRSVRLRKAKELLNDQGLSVSEVLYKVGFSNHSYFTKCFKDKFGKTPTELVQ